MRETSGRRSGKSLNSEKAKKRISFGKIRKIRLGMIFRLKGRRIRLMRLNPLSCRI